MEGSVFNWYEDSLSSEPIAVTETGSFTTPKLAETRVYFVSVVNSQGCESSKKEVLAEIIQLPPLEITEIGKDTLISNYPTGNLWFLDGEPIENGIGPLLVISEPGLYGLEVSIKDCQSSAQLDLVTDIPEDETTTEFVVFPNPVEDKLNIDFLEYPTPKIKLSLTDMQGREILKMDFKNSQKPLKLDFSQINRGVYMLNITKGGKEISKKVFKISSNFR